MRRADAAGNGWPGRRPGANAQEQPRCAPAAALSEALSSAYGETAVAAGMSGQPPNVTGMILTANPVTGTWTLIESLPDGTACIRGAGDGFRAVPQGVTG